MELIPLQAIPAQNIETTLANQSVILRVYQLRYGMFIDVTVSGALEVGAVICKNLTFIIRNTYLNRNVGFEGDFVFQDTQGNTNPVFPGLGTRYQLLYISPEDFALLPALSSPPGPVLFDPGVFAPAPVFQTIGT